MNFKYMDNLLKNAHRQGRDFLFEYEVYEILDSFDVRIPMFQVYRQDDTFEPSFLSSFDSEKVVLKIIHPYILHKTDFGGVKIVEKRSYNVLDSINEMLTRTPRQFADFLIANRDMMPEKYRELKDDEIAFRVNADTVGILIMEYIDYEKDDFGTELFIGLRHTREFDSIMSIGIGGVNTELFSENIKTGGSAVISSPIVSGPEVIFEKYQHTLSYKRLSGLLRGKRRIVDEERIKNLIGIMAEIASHYSFSGNSEFIISQMEINPFVCYGSDIMPIDGLLQFRLNKYKKVNKPLHKIKKLLEPSSCAIIGASSKGMNPGRIILHNLLENNFNRDRIYLVRPDGESVDNIKAYSSIRELPEKVDMLVLAISANQVADAVKEIISFDKAESVILIPGGMGETKEGKKLEKEVAGMIKQAHLSDNQGPVFVGGNCLGILSKKGNYDTLFIPQDKLPKPGGKPGNTALISQSGAFMITRMSNLPHLSTVYDISTGNQIDLSACDFLAYVKDDRDIKVIGIYVEGFNDLEGVEFARNVRSAVESGIDVIFYKAGRSPEGKTATSGHTASIAGDYDVCSSVLSDSGALVCDSFHEFEDTLQIASAFQGRKIKGNMVFCISNAGYEAVGMADNLRSGGELYLYRNDGDFNQGLYSILEKFRLNGLVNCSNPLDLTPMASDSAYEGIIRYVNDQKALDIIVIGAVPLTAAMKTLGKDMGDPDSLPERLGDFSSDKSKPVIFIVDSGDLFNDYVRSLREKGFPVFRSADRAMKALGKYISNKL